MIKWLRQPGHWLRFAEGMFWASIIGWPSTHALMIVTDPVENTWVFHVLLAISWFAITITAMGIIVTAEVRTKQQENE